MKYIGQDTATQYIRDWFGDKEQLTLEEVWQATGRADQDEEANNRWLANKMTHLRHWNLVDTVLEKEPPNRRLGIKLTPHGKKVLSAPAAEQGEVAHVMTASEINQLIQDGRRIQKMLQANLPTVNVVFDLQLKEWPMNR